MTRLKDLKDIALFLGIEPKILSYILYVLPKEKKYFKFEIQKKNKKTREISAPCVALKNLQKKLNEKLQPIYWENYLKRKNYVYGFLDGQNIVDNAKIHLKNRYVVNIDLENFFDTITFPRVRGLLMSYPFELPPKAATILAQILTFDFKLPQGAPSSPIISNFICAKLDGELWRFAQKVHCKYSRFADDMTFSTRKDSVLSQIGNLSDFDFKISPKLSSIIVENGFKINLSKTRCMTRYNRQEVTGLTVNDTVVDEH